MSTLKLYRSISFNEFPAFFGEMLEEYFQVRVFHNKIIEYVYNLINQRQRGSYILIGKYILYHPLCLYR